MSLPKPQTLGLKKSFGYGDRLGLATPGHLAAHKQFDFAPIFAQQSIREMTRTNRTTTEVMQAAENALEAAGYSEDWGADADHLKTTEDVDVTTAAGFCFFTIDPSDHVVNEADDMDESVIEARVSKMESDGTFTDAGWRSEYLDKSFDIGADSPITLDKEVLLRAAVKYGRAIAHTEVMARHIAQVNAGRDFEIEISVDETDEPTSPGEHLFFALELRRRNVPNVVSLAPRFVGHFEKGIDFIGDLGQFESSLKQHVAVARFCGPYKISVHSGSDKFSAYPIIGRVCGDLLHVKTAGTSYLEALRVVSRTEPTAFGEIAAYCRSRFDADKKSYHISTTSEEITRLVPFEGADQESSYLDERMGRQLLHVTFGSVLTEGTHPSGKPFRETILELAEKHNALHQEFLERHFVKHLVLLGSG